MKKTVLALQAQQQKLDYEQDKIDKLREITNTLVGLMEKFTKINDTKFKYSTNRKDYDPSAEKIA